MNSFVNDNGDRFDILASEIAESRREAENILNPLNLKYASAYVRGETIYIFGHDNQTFQLNKNQRAIANRIYDLRLSVKHFEITNLEYEELDRTADGDLVVAGVGPRRQYWGTFTRIQFPFQKGRYVRDEYFED